MSRVHEAAHSSPQIAGDVALPLPPGDPAVLRSSARSLEQAGARARATTTVRGTLGPRLGSVWTGDAADAARAEADELGRRSRRVVDALPAAARALTTYAAALDHAVGRVRALQREWDAVDAEHCGALLRLASLPDPTGVLAVVGVERARTEQVQARTRISRAYAAVMDELRATGRRCAVGVASTTDATVPSGSPATAAGVRHAVTGGLWFADGVVATRSSRDAALSDSLLARQVLATGADPTRLTSRVRARVDDPVYAQALLSELGAEGLSGLLVTAGVTRSATGARVDDTRALLGALGSLLVTATSHEAPTGTDPRTRAQLASGAALLADDVVASVATVQVGPDGGRATGAWLLGQLLAGARAAGDDRRLPARLVRRATAAAATAEVAETRDADVDLRHGTTLSPAGADTFASWFDDASRTGDAVHVLLEHVGSDPAEHVALLAEPLPLSAAAGGALANSRGDRLTVGEHLVRRWITHEANGIGSHPDLRLATDEDLARMLPSLSAVTTERAAETRARVMLEVSRTSRYAMLEASTTQMYTTATGPVEDAVGTWLSAMRDNVDRALTATATPPAGYVAPTAHGIQPWLETHELTGVVGALAVDTGMGLRARDVAAPYARLVDRELEAARAELTSGGDADRAVARVGFFDQSASAALTAVARRQDELNRAAWQSLAEAAHIAYEVRTDGWSGLESVVRTYTEGGTLRTAADDLAIAVVRSNVELEQTELDDSRRAQLLARIEAMTGGSTSVVPALALGAGRAPALPSASELRTARDAEIRAALQAVADEKASSAAGSAMDRLEDRLKDRLEQRPGPVDRVHVTDRPRRGAVDETLSKHVEPHERATAERLAAHGHHVTFLPAPGQGKAADALVDGELWEFKSPLGTTDDTIIRNLRKGSQQSPRVVIDLQRCNLSIAEVVRQSESALARYSRLHVILVITKDGQIIERRR